MVRAGESATAVVVGTVHDPASIDRTGFGATLRIERILAGTVPDPTAVRIGWEQFNPRMGTTFEEGQSILVALEPLPGGSLWRSRFPRRRALAISDRGAGFLPAPDEASIEAFARYLSVATKDREEAPGVAALAALVAVSHPYLAESAIIRLGDVPGLEGRLSESARESLGAALTDDARPGALRIQALELVGERRLSSLRPVCARLAIPGSPLEATALEAMAEIDGEIPAERTAALLQRAEPEIRRIAVVYGADSISDDKLRRMIVHDSGPVVRSAAVTVHLRRHGADGLDTATPALFDAEPLVRRDAALQIAALGSGVVPEVRSLTVGRSAEELTGVVAVLRLVGAAGQSVLVEIASQHPDERVRKLAMVALGRGTMDLH